MTTAVATAQRTGTENLSAVKDIQGALAYQNHEMVARYAKRHNVTEKEAQHLFNECKKFLVVTQIVPGPSSPSQQLDEMWHHFILHTGAYARFCEQYIGKFIHHNPTEEPSTANRTLMLETADQMFGIDRTIWPQAGITACESSCSGDNYCSDASCNGG